MILTCKDPSFFEFDGFGYMFSKCVLLMLPECVSLMLLKYMPLTLTKSSERRSALLALVSNGHHVNPVMMFFEFLYVVRREFAMIGVSPQTVIKGAFGSLFGPSS